MASSTEAVKVLSILRKTYPCAGYYLPFRTAVDLMVVAILSAQVRDEVVQAAAPALFSRFATAKDYAHASINEVVKYIKTVSFAGAKAKNIIAACRILESKYGGRVPATIEELTELPGIGRKTANVILSNAFNIVLGVAVDTHVIRISYRLGWTRNTNPDKIEQDLNALLPKVWWKQTQWLLKAHGRAVCKAPVPVCSACPLQTLCQKKGVIASV